LTPNQTNEVISQLSSKQLTKWVSELDSMGILGTGGLNKNERSDLFNNLASDLTVKQLARLHNAFDDKSIRIEMVAAVSNKIQASAVSSALQQRISRVPNGSNRVILEAEKQQLNKLQNAKQMARLSADSYRSDIPSNLASLPTGISRLDPNNLPLNLGIKKEDLMDENSGFYAAVYQTNKDNHTQYIVAFRGTEDGTDWKTNAKSAVMMTKQSKMASEVIKKITGGKNNVSVTGHSLGGGLSNYVAVKYDIPSTTFNAKGSTIPELLDTGDILGFKAARLIQNYQVKGEILTGLQEEVPLMFQAAGPKVKIPAIRPDGEEGNMLTETMAEVALSSVPFIGTELAKKHDISGPIDRHGMDYVERGMTSALNIEKIKAIHHLLKSFE
ncbi:MAG TPA: DUF2974 domain-containing protein, partial [Leucothrix sp.]|nr:DUF2974 domain-containing protein [Leucothrix sp.]